MIDSEDSGFDPEEIEEIERIMDAIMEEGSSGYQMIFWISVPAANELLESYDRYKAGSYQDAISMMTEFTKIIEQLREAMEQDEKGN